MADFTRIDVSGGLMLELTVGSPASVAVRAQENLLPITTTTVVDGRLTVRTSQSFTTTVGIRILVTMPTVAEISVSTGVLGAASGLAATELRINAREGAVLNLAGTAQTLEVTQDEGAVLIGTGFTTVDATVQLSAGAVSTFGATGTVTGSASGGAVLNLTGNPASVDVTTSTGAIVNR